MKAKRGFTLVEMLVAVFLSAMVIVALASIFGTALRVQTEGYQKNIVQAGTLLSVNQMTRDVGTTTSFYGGPAGTTDQMPCSSGNCSGKNIDLDTLIGCSNFDGVPGSSSYGMQPLDGVAANAKIYQYCVDSSGDMWYATADGSKVGFTASGAACTAANQASCACPSPNGATPKCGDALYSNGPVTKIATGVSHDPNNTSSTTGENGYFRRPGVSNIIELHYVVGSGTAAVTINQTVKAAKPVNSFSP